MQLNETGDPFRLGGIRFAAWDNVMRVSFMMFSASFIGSLRFVLSVLVRPHTPNIVSTFFLFDILSGTCNCEFFSSERHAEHGTDHDRRGQHDAEFGSVFHDLEVGWMVADKVRRKMGSAESERDE
jgi:hypothetical protein